MKARQPGKRTCLWFVTTVVAVVVLCLACTPESDSSNGNESEESGEEARFTGLYDRYVVIPQIAGSTCCAVALRTALMSACGTASTSPRYATKPPEVPCLSEGQHRGCLQCEETDTCPLINWEKIG